MELRNAAARRTPQTPLTSEHGAADRGNRYIGYYDPRPLKVKALRIDPMRQLIVETIDRQRVLQAIAAHLQSNITRHGVRTFRDAYR